MRYRIRPTPDVAEEIKGFEKKDLVELMSRAAKRMAAGDEDVHIERAVTWEGHSEAFAKWMVREVRASFAAFDLSTKPRTTTELAARAASRLAITMLLVLFGATLLQDRESLVTLFLLFPVVLLGVLYSLGFFIALNRLFARLTGRDKVEQDEDQ
jgi:hypothetical protein